MICFQIINLTLRRQFQFIVFFSCLFWSYPAAGWNAALWFCLGSYGWEPQGLTFEHIFVPTPPRHTLISETAKMESSHQSYATLLSRLTRPLHTRDWWVGAAWRRAGCHSQVDVRKHPFIKCSSCRITGSLAGCKSTNKKHKRRKEWLSHFCSVLTGVEIPCSDLSRPDLSGLVTALFIPLTPGLRTPAFMTCSEVKMLVSRVNRCPIRSYRYGWSEIPERRGN